MRSLLLILCLVFFLPAENIHAQSYTTTTVIDSLSMPVAFDFVPDGRIFLTEKGTYATPPTLAQIRVFDANFNDLGVFYNLDDSTYTNGECGVLGLAPDPAFVANHFIYVYYVHIANGDQHIRILRLTDVNNSGTNPTVILDIDTPDSLQAHIGGNLHFRPSEPDKIYFTIGERNIPSNAQVLSNPYGKVLRITTSGAIPTDNPFYDDGNPLTGNDDRIWSYGHRNPFDFCFGPNDSLYISENGALTWDEVDLGRRGGNYGWPACEGGYMNASTTIPCNTPGFIDPITDWNPTTGLTGIVFYNGTVMPAFDKHLLVADFDSHSIFDVTLGHAPVYDTVLSRTTFISQLVNAGLTALHQGPEGCLYVSVVAQYPNGKLMRICPQGLSVPAPGGVVEGFSAYPDPFDEHTVLHYTLAHPEKVHLVISDPAGRIFCEIDKGRQQQGGQEMSLDAKALGLEPGLYIVTLFAGETRSVLKIVYTAH